MATDLIIGGAGGSSREIAGAVVEINRVKETWNLLGFLDDDSKKTGALIDGLRVLGPLESAKEYPEVRFVVGIASYKVPSTRKKIVERLGLPDQRFATIVHPSASLSSFVRVGVGSVVLHNVVITSETNVGNHVLISQGAVLAHDINLADYATLAPGVVVAGGVVIKESAYIGAGAILAPGIVVEAESLVGIGSTVVNNVMAGSTVFGNPARAINLPGAHRRWSR